MKLKPKITKIKLTKEQLQEVDSILKDVIKYTKDVRKKLLKQAYGGSCSICGNFQPDYKVNYNVGDRNQKARRVEYYCSKCFDRRKHLL